MDQTTGGGSIRTDVITATDAFTEHERSSISRAGE